MKTEMFEAQKEQGRIHGNKVGDSFAGAVMQKPLAIQKYYKPIDRWMDGRTNRPTQQGVELCV